MLLHYLGKLKIQIFCRYSAHMEENANKLHFKSTDFNSYMHVTVYSIFWVYLCVLSKSCPHHWIPCWLLTNTAATSAVTNFCHKLVAKVNKQKNSDMENFICNQYGEKLTIFNSDNMEFCGWITKVQVIAGLVFCNIWFMGDDCAVSVLAKLLVSFWHCMLTKLTVS